MTQVLNVQLPADLLGVAAKMVGAPGVPVAIPRVIVTHIDQAIHKTLSESLISVRDRERSASSEALKLRVR